ncbi:MAG: MMPL family transporter, partial [Proteobacteria bacterium]|nr:MMPL family transporter [Pseudomonadota bacterium]
MRDRQDKWSRYTSWLQRWRIAIFVTSALVIGAGGYLAAQLALHSDLSSLLPPSKRSVRDLDVLRTRARSFGNVLVMLEAPSPAAREVAVAALEADLRQLPPALVAQVSLDDNAAARFGWEHRFLFASTDDLRAAREALADRLRTARLAKNPLYVDLDDPEPARDTHRLDDLRHRLADAKAAAAAPHARLSPDGTAQLLSMQVTFPSSDVTRSRDVMARVRAIATRLEARFPGTRISLAGSINISIYEHDSVIAGMALSAGITLVLVFAALFLYYRSFFSVLGALWALLVGLAFTLGFTRLAIGHLNLLSAFLTAIVVGNGINPGLIVLSRFGEELRAGASPKAAIAPALGGSLHGTLAASLTAAVAYAALIVTDFRGFRHFGIIGGVGMIACWIATYTVLPVTLGWLADRDAIKERKPPPISELVARLAPRHGGRVLALAAVIVAVALVVTVRFLTHDPFQKDWRDLQADSAEIVAQHVVDQQMTARFSKNPELSGHSYKLAIAVDRAEQVPDVVARLRADAATRAPGHELFVDIKSIDDLLPPDQGHKLVELAAIRALFDDPAIAQLDDQERADLLELR